jgi:hypothetical protein
LIDEYKVGFATIVYVFYFFSLVWDEYKHELQQKFEATRQASILNDRLNYYEVIQKNYLSYKVIYWLAIRETTQTYFLVVQRTVCQIVWQTVHQTVRRFITLMWTWLNSYFDDGENWRKSYKNTTTFMAYRFLIKSNFFFHCNSKYEICRATILSLNAY